MPPPPDRQRSLLTAALGFALLDGKSPELARVRSCSALLPDGVNWREALETSVMGIDNGPLALLSTAPDPGLELGSAIGAASVNPVTRRRSRGTRS